MGTPAGNPLSLDQWKALAREGQAPADAVLHKAYTCEAKALDEGSRKIAFTISTGAVDRDRDTIRPEGWKLAEYRKNPVVLWAHDRFGLPIAKASDVRVETGALKAVAEFVAAEDYPFADTVYRLLKGKFLRSTSVGFLPDFDKAMWNEERGGFDFKAQTLLEFSVVPVPANPEALMDGKAAGIDLGPMREWAERCLDSFEPGGWMAKAELEAARAALAEPTIAFDGAAVVEEFQKVGRRLSAATEANLRTARTATDAIAVALDSVLESPVVEEPKAAPVLYLAPAPKYVVQPSVVVAAVQAAVQESVREQINYARGRLD